MYTFVGLSGTIPCPSGMKLSVSKIFCDYSNTAASTTAITLSGSYSSHPISFSAKDQISLNIKFKYNEDISVESSGGLTNVIINYKYVGNNIVAY